ncbi:MAG: endonuclease/exonuclease/phosphatase family protein [Acidimicrobiia bacterium]|nr:endonuclease/exonuclease/phosphatase family protein [Acidimicrobiia bacterium]
MAEPILRVATFNIRHGADDADRVRLRALAWTCAGFDADLLGLQEVVRGRRASLYLDQGAVVARRSRARQVSGPAVQRRWLRRYGNSLVVRGRVTERAVIDLPRSPEREPRTAIVARVAVRGLEVSVAVTHLQHWPKRHRHLAHDAPVQLRAVLDALVALPAPRVLLGDLNLAPPEVAPILAEAGFVLAEHGPTYPADVPRLRLDHVAVDGFVVRRAWVAERAPVSDHRAVVAELAVTPSDRAPSARPPFAQEP